MNYKDISTARLRSQRLDDDTFINAEQVVSWFGAIQGQEYALTRWAIGLRAPGLTDPMVEQELTEGHILRTHLLRPTLHFVSAKDIRWMLKLTAPTVHQASAFMYRSLKMNPKLFLKCNNIIEKALEGGRSLTRDALNEQLKKNRVVASGPRLGYIMMNAELEGLICSGPRVGKQFTYALLDERAAPTEALPRDEALSRLTRIYLTSRGPATINDFATWSGLKIADCKQGIASSAPHIIEERIGGVLYYVSSSGPTHVPGNGMRLLPIYDELIMGYKDRSALFEYRNSVTKAPKLRYNCMILWNNQVIGTWRRVEGTKAIETQFDFFAPLTGLQKKDFKAAFKRLERFSQRKIEVSTGQTKVKNQRNTLAIARKS